LEQKVYTDDDDDNGDSPKSLWLPNWTHWDFFVSLGPPSSGVINTPYVNDRIRIDKAGTLETQFVIFRVPETDAEATDEWKWLLGSTDSTCIITNRKASWGLATAGILSAIGWRLLTGRRSRRVSITSAILSVGALLGVVLSTGDIETRGGTWYAPGK
jgi:hypothetical protein